LVRLRNIGYRSPPRALGAAVRGAVLIILLVAIVVLYVIVVLLGFVGIHLPMPGFR
jgi:hypothetical protein